jgi:peptidoglycan/LPS O-acetylase OafA/YrhL
VVACGCYLAVKEQYGENFKYYEKIISSIMVVAGIGFIIRYKYTEAQPVIFTEWTGTSFVASMYIIPIVWLIIRKNKNLKINIMQLFGKASYEIFLTQMVFYNFVSAFLNRKAFLILSVLICVTFGVIFYVLDNRLVKKILQIAFEK